MSRVGDAPIKVPDNVKVTVDNSNVLVSGSLGNLNFNMPTGISIEGSEGQLLVKRANEEQNTRALHGLTRSLISNMVIGVDKGWTKQLELVGVGYRAQTNGMQLTLNVGFSHSVVIEAPEGVKFTVTDNTKILVSGFDRQVVGQVAAKVRAVKPPEPYQGKGIRYSGERVRRKAGKAGKVGAGAK